MKNYFIIIILLGTAICSAQISMLPKATAKVEDQAELYDSITNFPRTSDWRCLKGQTIYLSNSDAHTYRKAKDYRTGEEIPIYQLAKKYLYVETANKTSGSRTYVVLKDTLTGKVFSYEMGIFDDKDWIVMGYYEKIRQKFLNQEFMLMNYEELNLMVYKDYPIYCLATHKAIKNLDLKSRWKCTDITVDSETSHMDIGKTRIVLQLFNEKYGECYCFADCSSNSVNKKNEYETDAFKTYYIADKFMPASIYDQQQQQAQQKRNAAAVAKKKAEQEKKAKQKATAESVLKRQQLSK